MTTTYTLTGRTIYRDGMPLLDCRRAEERIAGALTFAADPAEVDRTLRRIVRLLNAALEET